MNDSNISKRAGIILTGLSILTCAVFSSLLYLGWQYLPVTDNINFPQLVTNPVSNPSPLATVVTTELGLTTYTVSAVVDGDTIKINNNGKIETVRLIGIDTPELKGTNGTADCFALTAKLALEQEIGNNQVYLEIDSSQGTLDKYGRTLAYVWKIEKDNTKTDLNLMQIAKGNALEYTYNKAYKYQTEYRNAQKQAQQNGLGLWSACKVS